MAPFSLSGETFGLFFFFQKVKSSVTERVNSFFRDWNYDGDYENHLDNTNAKKAKGFNYHNGPVSIYSTSFWNDSQPALTVVFIPEEGLVTLILRKEASFV